jgi:hypothetical protein
MTCFFITIKHVSGVTVFENLPRMPKLWAIAHETAIKRENDDFFVITLKDVSGLTGHANRPETPKFWGIAHENGHKMRKR